VTRELFVLLVRIPVKAGFENEYLSLINAVIDEMRHETSFVNAVVHRSTEDPTRF
jgi:quinol monooxygenase YgiN